MVSNSRTSIIWRRTSISILSPRLARSSEKRHVVGVERDIGEGQGSRRPEGVGIDVNGFGHRRSSNDRR